MLGNPYRARIRDGNQYRPAADLAADFEHPIERRLRAIVIQIEQEAAAAISRRNSGLPPAGVDRKDRDAKPAQTARNRQPAVIAGAQHDHGSRG